MLDIFVISKETGINFQADEFGGIAFCITETGEGLVLKDDSSTEEIDSSKYDVGVSLSTRITSRLIENKPLTLVSK